MTEQVWVSRILRLKLKTESDRHTSPYSRPAFQRMTTKRHTYKYI